jgi:hypothetical protein
MLPLMRPRIGAEMIQRVVDALFHDVIGRVLL